MDILTHFLFGTFLGTLLGVNKELIIVLGIANIAPDLDMLSILFGFENYFRFHRGLFHSFLGAFFISLLAVLIITLFIRIGWQQILLIAILGGISHVTLDVIGPWKMPLFYPLRDKVSFDLLYYSDPVILMTLITTNLLLYKNYLTNSQKLVVIVVCFVVLSSFIYARFYEKSLASKYGKPLPTMNFNIWYSVSEENNMINVYKVHSGQVVDKWTFNKPIIGEGIQPINSKEKAAGYSMKSEMVKSFLTRARYPLVEVEGAGNNYTVTWSDVIFKIERASMISGVRVKIYDNGEMHSEILRRY
jgi:membrane-bound metal-dependent hydrolase YbcI (DUF457 family)